MNFKNVRGTKKPVPTGRAQRIIIGSHDTLSHTIVKNPDCRKRKSSRLPAETLEDPSTPLLMREAKANFKLRAVFKFCPDVFKWWTAGQILPTNRSRLAHLCVPNITSSLLQYLSLKRNIYKL